MNRTDGIIFSVAIAITLGLVLYVVRIGGGAGRTPPKAAALDVAASTVLGKAPQLLGNSKAPFTLVEFADYQCPACVAAKPRVLALLKAWPEKLKLRFRHFPLPMHKDALPAAILAEQAAKQGKFWPMHDVLMEAGAHLRSTDLEKYSAQMGLDEKRLHADVKAATDAVNDDLKLGRSIGINSTPSFVLCRPDGKSYLLGALDHATDFLKE